MIIWKQNKEQHVYIAEETLYHNLRYHHNTKFEMKILSEE